MTARKARASKKIEPSFATWKFELLDTMNGDPELSGSHLQVMLPYLRFCDGPSKAVFLSMTDLRIKTGLAQATIREVKKTLQRLGYLEKRGFADCGADLFAIRNPRKELVSSIRLGKSSALRRIDADRKAKLRLRMLAKREASHEVSPSNSEGPVSSVPLKMHRLSPSEFEGKYVSTNTELSSMEERNHTQVNQSPSSNTYHAVHDEDEVPFLPPSSEAEVEEMISAIAEGENLTGMQRFTLRKQLVGGFLSPASAKRMLDHFRNVSKEKSNAAA